MVNIKKNNQDLKLSELLDNRNVKVVKFPPQCTGRFTAPPPSLPLTPPGNIFGAHFCKRLGRHQDHDAAGRKKIYDPSGIEPVTIRF